MELYLYLDFIYSMQLIEKIVMHATMDLLASVPINRSKLSSF